MKRTTDPMAKIKHGRNLNNVVQLKHLKDAQYLRKDVKMLMQQ